VLIRAIAQIPEAHLVLVGDGPERETLEQLVTTLQIADRVTMVGWAESPTAYLLTFDILAMPSRFEGLPLVLLEAMLHGLPVVATGVGSISDVVTSEETALLVPVEDVAALRVAIVRLGRDDQLRERLAIAASRVARRDFTAEAMARGYERLYAELLGQ
jgi:glycosyltransferase involved in cell wall biosynthesis